jgi:hypothetical protein
MTTLRIEHPVRDFDLWKQAYDSDPTKREQSGVRRYRVLQATDDPNYVMIDLDFDNLKDAEAMLASLRDLWRTRNDHGAATTRFAEVKETKEY